MIQHHIYERSRVSHQSLGYKMRDDMRGGIHMMLALAWKLNLLSWSGWAVYSLHTEKKQSWTD